MRGDNLSATDLDRFTRRAVRILPGKTAPAVVLICEHASCAVPEPWGRLGLAESRLTDHIGWDIGAGDVTALLSERLAAPAFLSGYSRLFVECNRMPAAEDFIAAVSDGVPVPGNQDLSEAERQLRKRLAYDPFHEAIARYLDKITMSPRRPVVVSVHSFTPRMAGQHRPWPLGVLWKGDCGFAKAVAAALERQGVVPVGRNQPYDPGAGETMTVDFHASPRKLSHVIFEIRNDLIRNPAGVRHWTDLIADSLLATLPECSGT